MSGQILTSKKGSFARFTIETRIPAILGDLLAGNRFSSDVAEELTIFTRSVPSGSPVPLSPAYPFAQAINNALIENPGYSWLNAPFLFLENYLYHKIADICGFFDNRIDYFFYKKEADILKGLDKIRKELQRIETVRSFSEISLLNLMGNKADLSQNGSYYSADTASELLIDHRDKAATAIMGSSKIDIVLDNAGEELFYDLLLVYWLFKHTGILKIQLHFKQMPYFVSDAMISDYRLLLNVLSENRDTSWFAEELQNFEKEGKLVLSDDSFWSSGQLYSALPSRLLSDFSKSDLIVFKGDLNYRRLVGDSSRPFETATKDLVDYLPADILISRILKCEVMAGLSPEKIPDRNSREWMYSGRYGQIEFTGFNKSKL